MIYFFVGAVPMQRPTVLPPSIPGLPVNIAGIMLTGIQSLSSSKSMAAGFQYITCSERNPVLPL